MGHGIQIFLPKETVITFTVQCAVFFHEVDKASLGKASCWIEIFTEHFLRDIVLGFLNLIWCQPVVMHGAIDNVIPDIADDSLQGLLLKCTAEDGTHWVVVSLRTRYGIDSVFVS